MDITPAQADALKIAGELIDAGIPVFAAAPDPDRPGEYFLPKGWQWTAPDRARLESWRPGWALGAVGGHQADFLDFDPRSGGRESRRELEIQGQMPRSFGTQRTPSGGEHEIISLTGERKATGFMPGVDLQSGSARPDELGTHGRGFVYIAPTVRPSKAPETLGQLRAYVWEVRPDLDYLSEFSGPDGTSSDETIEGVIARVHASRSTGVRESALSTATRAADPSASQLFSAGFGGRREFTRAEAEAFCLPHLEVLEAARIGEIEESANRAAAALSHFVPALWSADEAFTVLGISLSKTAYDPHGPSRWTAEKFRAVLDGRRPPIDDWKAVKKVTVADALAAVPGEPTEPVSGRLRRAMFSRSQMRELPDPIPLIDGVIWRNSVTVLSGKFGTYKSFVAVSWACSLATGRPWHGHAVPAAVPVIYAAAEGAYGIRKRIDAWEQHHGVTVPDSLYLISVPVRLNRSEDLTELVDIVQETKAAVLVFDTLHMSTPGVDENDSGQMGAVMDVLREMQHRYGVTSVLPHHTGHAGERARGSSSVEDDADTSFVIRLDGEDRGPAGKRTLIHRKAKDSALLPDEILFLKLVDGTGSGVVGPIGAFEEATRQAATGQSEDIGQRSAIREVQPWTRVAQPVYNAVIQWQILQALRDTAHAAGRTEDKILGAVADRWYGGNVGRKSGYLNKQTFGTSWTAVLALEGGRHGRIVIPGESGSKSYVVNPDWLAEFEKS